MNDKYEDYEYLEPIRNDLIEAEFLCKLPTGEPIEFRLPIVS